MTAPVVCYHCAHNRLPIRKTLSALSESITMTEVKISPVYLTAEMTLLGPSKPMSGENTVRWIEIQP
ncbi:hypothetical protein N7517_002758 [Penicillium concentricum]|uniref:Uncharacterized protein n=1 Tax=Penicillium concentricum TaxID=293559 RepID=A0A9W9SUZ0_9EURO|nr:uncharacterized protein N7517_002758 [Penicillium concentricum]KAJ5384847.1 hypothetical protein N7517_002758 [Penicillium concentricum]